MKTLQALGLGVLSAGLVGTAVAGDQPLYLYTKVHMSGDWYDTTDGGMNLDGVNLSSNSTRIGVAGSKDIGNGITAIYVFESQYNPNNESDDELSGRNRFVGIEGRLGTLLVGSHDTPFKLALTKTDKFNDTIGEGRSIFGSTASGSNRFNERADNSIMYISPNYTGFSYMVQYSTDNDSGGSSSALDDDSYSLGSIAAKYSNNGLDFVLSYEKQRQPGAADRDGFRLGLGWSNSQWGVGALFEQLDSEVNGGDVYDRAAYGVYGHVKVTGNDTLRAMYAIADDYDNVNDSGANLLSLGWFHKVSSNLEIYAMYAMLDNDTNAMYNLGNGGHGESISADGGKSAKSVSLGAVFKFDSK